MRSNFGFESLLERGTMGYWRRKENRSISTLLAGAGWIVPFPKFVSRRSMSCSILFYGFLTILGFSLVS